MTADDAQHNRRAKPPTGKLGGKERFKHAARRSFIHATAGIGYRQFYIGSVSHIGRGDEIMQGIAIDLPSAQAHRGHALLVADGLEGIGHQVQHHLADLGWIALHQGYVVSETENKTHLGRARDFQDAGGLLDDLS